MNTVPHESHFHKVGAAFVMLTIISQVSYSLLPNNQLLKGPIYFMNEILFFLKINEFLKIFLKINF